MSSGCNVEISGLPVLGTCPAGVSYVMLIGVPALITATNPGGYGLISYTNLSACLNEIEKPLKFIAGVDSPTIGGPVVGTTAYQNNALIGLGSDNNYRIDIYINGGLYSNWQPNGNLITFNQSTGLITGLPQWYTNDSLEISLNQ